MARTNASARAAGTRHERAIADYLALHVDDRIDRRPKMGAKDRGDIGGLRHMGGRIVIECKNTSRLDIGTWIRETETERGNDDALAGIVIAKRHGKAAPADQLVLMTLGDLVALLTGTRHHLHQDTDQDSAADVPVVSRAHEVSR